MLGKPLKAIVIIICLIHTCYKANTGIGSVMLSMLASSVVDRGFKPWSGQTKDYEIDICCFSAK
jgi:hypothetical protein